MGAVRVGPASGNVNTSEGRESDRAAAATGAVCEYVTEVTELTDPISPTPEIVKVRLEATVLVL